MASDRDSTHEADYGRHEDYEWDAQRDNFVRYYKDENKTLKEATLCMIENHAFYATPRQWERKMSAWGVSKYTPRSERMHQIQSQGRTLVEVAQTGRRPRKYSNSNNLPVADNRNIRRFARRALSRSRSRSSSAGQRSPSLNPRPDPPVDDLVVQERTFDLDLSVLEHDPNPSSIPAALTNQDTDNAQAHVLDLEDPLTGYTHTDVLLAFPTPHRSRSTTPAPVANTVPFEQFPAYGDAVASNPDMDTNMSALNVNTGYGDTNMFIAQPTDSMDLSPGHGQDQPAHWTIPQPFRQENLGDSYSPNMPPVHQGFEQAHLSPVQSRDFPPDMNSPLTPISSVPMVVISEDAPSPHPIHSAPAVGEYVGFTPVSSQGDLALADPYPDFSQHVHEYALGVQQTFSSFARSAQPADMSERQLEQCSKGTTAPLRTSANRLKEQISSGK